ncbi:MAG: 3-deoxy-manno-octulosonate cytidylyltransferase [Acidobacteria bacterium]|nr:3-deoxy-manno-octulosonate cytidylyltransferase [Acidobacteriota bacterium]
MHGRVVAIIPARYHATRLPGKPLALIGGVPMIEHVYRRASAASLVSTVLVATDDSRIADAVDAFGGTAVMTSQDHLTGTDRLAEVAQFLQCDIVVNVQGDEPLLDPAAVDAAIAACLNDSSVVLSTLRTPLAESDASNPNVVKVVIDLRGDALYFTRASVPYVRPGHAQAQAWRHLGLYVYRRATLCALARLHPTPLEQAEGLEQLRALEHGFRLRTVETLAASPSVDTPADLDRVRLLMSGMPQPASVIPHA